MFRRQLISTTTLQIDFDLHRDFDIYFTSWRGAQEMTASFKRYIIKIKDDKTVKIMCIYYLCIYL